MNSIVKPILFMCFVIGFLFFLNLVCFFISINKLGIVTNHIRYIVTLNGENTDFAKSEVDNYLSSVKGIYNVKYEYEYDNKFLDSTLITVGTEYRYIGMDKKIDFNKQVLVMNTQM